MLTSCCKQATDGRTVADLVQSCLLGSHCVLTWRETENYSHAGKRIIVTSLVTLFVSCPDGVRRKINWPMMPHGVHFVCVCLFACLPPCPSFDLSVYLFISSTAACLLPHISACLFLSCRRCFNAAKAAEEKNCSSGLEPPYIHLSIVPQIVC